MASGSLYPGRGWMVRQLSVLVQSFDDQSTAVFLELLLHFFEFVHHRVVDESHARQIEDNSFAVPDVFEFLL